MKNALNAIEFFIFQQSLEISIMKEKELQKVVRERDRVIEELKIDLKRSEDEFHAMVEKYENALREKERDKERQFDYNQSSYNRDQSSYNNRDGGRFSLKSISTPKLVPPERPADRFSMLDRIQNRPQISDNRSSRKFSIPEQPPPSTPLLFKKKSIERPSFMSDQRGSSFDEPVSNKRNSSYDEPVNNKRNASYDEPVNNKRNASYDEPVNNKRNSSYDEPVNNKSPLRTSMFAKSPLKRPNWRYQPNGKIGSV
jgi:hypothetical protein